VTTGGSRGSLRSLNSEHPTYGPHAEEVSDLNGTRVAQMSHTLPLNLNSNPLGIGRHVSGIADPFNGHIDEFRVAHVQRSDGWRASGSPMRQSVAHGRTWYTPACRRRCPPVATLSQ
jgi:hypothetical protein